MSQGDLFESTLALLQRAALEDRYRRAAAARFNDAAGTIGHGVGLGVVLAGGEVDPMAVCFVFGRQRREDWEREYVRDYLARDERLPPLGRLPRGELAYTGDLLTESERKTSRVYNEMLCDMRARNGLNVLLNGPWGTQIFIALADPIEAEGWSSGQIEVIEQLVPHLGHSISVRQALIDARAQRETLTGLLDNTRTCIIQLDRWGKVVEANDVASDILRQRDALTSPGGFLRAVRPAEDAELQQLLAGALPSFGGQAVGGSMVIRRSPSSRNLLVHVTPVGAELAELRDSRAEGVAVVVLAVSPASRVCVDPDLVASALRLTPAESRLAVMLAAGHTVRDIAVATGREEGSVHWHLRQIFRKQGIGSQVELIRRVLSIQALSRPTHDPKSPQSFDGSRGRDG